MRWKIAQWFEIRWWKRYLGTKDPEEYLAWKRAYWSSFLQDIELSAPNSLKILDAGCGPAGIFTILDENDVVAVDPLLNKYTKHLSVFDASKYPWVKFENRSLEDYSSPNTYDIVFCINVINHVKDLSAANDNLCNSLKNEGALILSIDCHNSRLMKWLFRLIPGDILHPHQHDLGDYEKMLSDRGLRIDRRVRLKTGNLFDYYALVATKN